MCTFRQFIRSLLTLFLTPVVLIAVASAAEPASQRGGDSVLGQYMCRSMGSRQCNTSTPLRLAEGGAWGWGRYNGDFEVAGEVARFRGVGGAATWGPATVGPDTLTFMNIDVPVVWQKPSKANPSLAGAYTCTTAPGGVESNVMCWRGPSMSVAQEERRAVAVRAPTESIIPRRVISNLISSRGRYCRNSSGAFVSCTVTVPSAVLYREDFGSSLTLTSQRMSLAFSCRTPSRQQRVMHSTNPERHDIILL